MGGDVPVVCCCLAEYDRRQGWDGWGCNPYVHGLSIRRAIGT